MRRKSRLMLETSFRVGTRCSGDLILRGVTMTLPEVTMQFSTETRCRELLERLRWPEGVMCPRCKDARVSRMKDYARFECVGCEYQFTVTSGTIFHDTHLPMPIWFLAVLLICEAKKGMSAMPVETDALGRAQRLLQDGVVSVPSYPCGDGVGGKEHDVRNSRNG
jgi:transposase-like protein